MENTPKIKKEKKSPTERQAFSTWVLALFVFGMGVGVAICGLNGILNRVVGDDPPGSVEFLVVGALVVFVGALLLRSVPKGLRPFERFAKDRTAVSPVIAVVLMVAITVVLAAAVFVVVSDVGTVSEVPPQVAWEKGDDWLRVLQAPDELRWDELDVVGCGSRAVNPTVEVGGRVSAGDTLLECSGFVTVRHVPTNSLLYSTEF